MQENKFLGIAIEYWALFISFFTFIFTLLKDFIIPWFLKPELKFAYEEKAPYRRDKVTYVIPNVNGQVQNCIGSFLRMSVKNVGNRPALNCRCQIYKVINNKNEELDYSGYPLKWASRPESLIDPLKGERLNIAVGETEYIDIVNTGDQIENILLQKYHQIRIGMNDYILPGKYQLMLIFSGDNFKPRIIKFRIEKEDNLNPSLIKLSLENIEILNNSSDFF